MLEERGIDLKQYPRIQAREYIDDMALWTAAADLVVSRAGAITISELEVIGKPSILSPLSLCGGKSSVSQRKGPCRPWRGNPDRRKGLSA